MRRWTRATAAVAVTAATAGVLGAAGPAAAKIPHFGPKTIVPGQSIGGVAIGMTAAHAKAIWGRPDRCQPAGRGVSWCQYLALKDLGTVRLNEPFAGYYVRAGRVIAVELEEARNAVDPRVNRKVHEIRSRKHIRVGSSTGAVRRAYHIGPIGKGEAGLSRYILHTRPRRCTLFYAPQKPYVTVTAIQVGICGAAGLV